MITSYFQRPKYTQEKFEKQGFQGYFEQKTAIFSYKNDKIAHFIAIKPSEFTFS